MMNPDGNCPFCKGILLEEAELCSHCGERVAGKMCEDCRSLCPAEARKCRWCGYRFRESATKIGIEEFEVTAKRLPTLFIRLRLLCQSVRFNEDKLVVSTPGIFRLWTNEVEIPWNKVAGFDYRSGIFWDGVEIETRGQKPTKIGCLSKQDGKRIRDVLRSLEI